MKIVTLCLSLILFLSHLVVADLRYYLEVKGSHQGEIYPSSNSTHTNNNNGVPANSTPILASAPYSPTAGTGQGAGLKPSFGPVSVLKNIDSGTAQLMQVLVTLEILQTVTVTAIETGGGNVPQAVQSGLTMVYTLTNAQITYIEHDGTAQELVETVEFAFRKMEIDVTVGGKTNSVQFNS